MCVAILSAFNTAYRGLRSVPAPRVLTVRFKAYLDLDANQRNTHHAPRRRPTRYSYARLSLTLIRVALLAGSQLASSDSTPTTASHTHTPVYEK